MSEAEYQQTFGLTDGQMLWRRAKIAELRSTLLFRREYPATVQDAWSATPDHLPLIQPLTVLRARKRRHGLAHGPLIIGVDPASSGGDRFAAAGRRTTEVEWVKTRNKLNHEEAVAWVVSLIEEYHPAMVCIDAGNIGANIVSSLKGRSAELARIVVGVNFGGASEWKMARPKVPGPWNRRAEMWMRMRDWLEASEPAVLPDDDAIQADLCAPMEKPRLDNWMMLESKKDMKARGVRSPDEGDAIALTFSTKRFFQDFEDKKDKPTFGEFQDFNRQSSIVVPTQQIYTGGYSSNDWMG